MSARLVVCSRVQGLHTAKGTGLRASPPTSAPVIVSTGRTILLLQQQWQVFKETAVYTRMFYAAKPKNLPSSPLWLQTKAAHTKSTPCRSTQWKADAAVLRALENFLIKSWCLCSSALNNQQRIEALSGDDAALDTVTAKSCLQMCYPNTETHVTVC